MVRSYYSVAFRNIFKRKIYSLINIVGLSIGIAFSLLVYLFIQDEKSFDQFHVDKDDIFRIDNKAFSFMAFKSGEKEPFEETAYHNAKLGEAMVDELAEVKYMTRYFGPVDGLLKYQNRIFSERFTCVDSGFFKMFSFRLVAGNVNKIFKNKSEIVLTQKAAQKYFGSVDPIGKLMALDVGGESTVTVVGVIESPPANSSISFDILIPLEKLPWFKSTWDSGSYPTFVQLQPGTDLRTFKKNLNELHQKYVPDNKEFRDREKIPDEYQMTDLYFTNLTNIHLDTGIAWEKSSDPNYAFILGGIAILVLIIACINYISLALTNSSTRKIEVGVRKVSGAFKRQLIFQFGMESVVLAFSSMIIGIFLVIALLPAFNSFTNKGIDLSSVSWLTFITVAIILTGSVGVIAGSYPAFYLSGLKPTQVLKGTATKANPWFTKPIVIVQFTLSFFLILSSIVMYDQMKFITTKDLGYDQHQVLFIPTQQGWDDKSDRFVENFRAAVANEPSVISVGGTSIAFTYGTMTMGYNHKGESKVASGYIVDPQYMTTLNIQLLEGRNFDINNPADLSDAVIVNEALAKDLKWTDPLNEHLQWRLDKEGPGSKVIGVVKDHHFLSLEKSISPMFLTMDKTFGHLQWIIVKIAANDIPGSVKKLQKSYKALAPDKPFEYTFLDENIQLQYQSYQRWMSIMGFSSGFAILISCLGLFGLTGINIVNRTKEIGIRKVLGAGLGSIFILLNKQFIWLLISSFLLAAFPVWYAMNKWLDNFQFKTQLSLVSLVISLALSLAVVMITVSYHTVKAIRLNAADTLKHE